MAGRRFVAAGLVLATLSGTAVAQPLRTAPALGYKPATSLNTPLNPKLPKEGDRIKIRYPNGGTATATVLRLTRTWGRDGLIDIYDSNTGQTTAIPLQWVEDEPKPAGTAEGRHFYGQAMPRAQLPQAAPVQQPQSGFTGYPTTTPTNTADSQLGSGSLHYDGGTAPSMTPIQPLPRNNFAQTAGRLINPNATASGLVWTANAPGPITPPKPSAQSQNPVPQFRPMAQPSPNGPATAPQPAQPPAQTPPAMSVPPTVPTNGPTNTGNPSLPGIEISPSAVPPITIPVPGESGISPVSAVGVFAPPMESRKLIQFKAASATPEQPAKPTEPETEPEPSKEPKKKPTFQGAQPAADDQIVPNSSPRLPAKQFVPTPVEPTEPAR